MNAYTGRWVAQIKNSDTIVGHGTTGPEALRQGRNNRPKAKLDVSYVPDQSGEPLALSPILQDLKKALSRVDQPVYLVGGAVRDAMLGRISHDLDFVVPQDGVKVAFQIGDFLRAPAFPLDEERGVGRVVLKKWGIYLDIACFRSNGLEGDLIDRDFTLNAIALPALATHTAELIDPLGGGDDLANNRLRMAHPDAFISDPVRILRGVRMMLKYDLMPEPGTAEAMQSAILQLKTVSPERVRDELLNILNIDGADGIQTLHDYGLLEYILPKIVDLVGIQQTEPHFEPVFSHTISVLRWLQKLLNREILHEWISPILEKLTPYFDRPVTGNRHGWDLILLAALYHDVGKASTQSSETNADGSVRYRFFEHDKVGAKITNEQLRYFKFSVEAIQHTSAVVDGHMRPLLLSAEPKITVRAKHRFWKKYGAAGIDICLLSVADHLATYNGQGPEDKWQKFQATIDDMLNHWFTIEDPAVKKEPLVDGRFLIDGLQIKGGPEIGRLLALIEEAAVAGEISTAAEALELAKQSLSDQASST